MLQDRADGVSVAREVLESRLHEQRTVAKLIT